MNATGVAESEPQGPGHAKLGLWDTVSIIVGIVIGSSVFTTPPTIFSNVPGPWEALGVWFVGGVLSLIGALCYAELATTYPRSGGDYVYLTRAFGRPVGFLFGWAQLAVILSGSTGAMAFIFGEYFADLLVEDTLIVELKAVKTLVDEHVAQLLGYLRSSRREHGLLINFGSAILQVKKYALSDPNTQF